MPNARPIRSACAALGLLVLASCAGAQLSPGGGNGVSDGTTAQAARRSPGSVRVSPFADKAASALFFARAQVRQTHAPHAFPWRVAFNLAPQNAHGSVPKPPPYSYLFLSDNVTGNLDVYNESNGTQISLSNDTPGMCGWGIATYTIKTINYIACGNTTDGILVGTVGQNALTWIGSLKPSAFASGGEALGLTFDAKGDLYGTNFPISGSASGNSPSCIDFWPVGTVQGSPNGAAPLNTYCSPQFAYVFYLTVDGAALFADGLSSSQSQSYGGFEMAAVTVKKVAGGKGVTKLLQPTLATPAGQGFPGGMAVQVAGTKHELYVNNQYGEFYGFKKPWSIGQSATDTELWTFTPDDYTAICLDWSETNLWAADIYLSTNNVEGFGAENSMPLGTLNTLLTSPAQINDNYLGCGLEPTGKT